MLRSGLYGRALVSLAAYGGSPATAQTAFNQFAAASLSGRGRRALLFPRRGAPAPAVVRLQYRRGLFEPLIRAGGFVRPESRFRGWEIS